MKRNEKGIGALVIILAVLVLGLIGFAGYKITNKNKNTSNSSAGQTDNKDAKTTDTTAAQQQDATAAKAETPPATQKVDITKDWITVAPKNTGSTFIVKVPKSLTPSGSCTTKEVLLALTNNSANNDYSCSGTLDALQYASIVFGVSTKSIVPILGTAQTTSKATLADGKTEATKSVITTQAKGGGGSYTARYVVYEAVSKTTSANYYGVYKTGVGFSDEDTFLKDFEAAIVNGWTLP